MALPERAKSDTFRSLSNTELLAALAETDRQLEVADENENPIERLFKRGELLEQRDLIEAEINAASSASELP